MQRLVGLRALATAAALGAVPLVVVPAVAAVPGSGCSVFPANNVWNTDISTLPVNANSAAWMASTGAAGRNLHPDFGPSGDLSVPYGIPFAVVGSAHPRVHIGFQYAGESDPGPYPLGPDTPIEGGPSSIGDRHALIVDRSSCSLYELYDTHYRAGGSTAGSGAVFQLGGNGLRPSGWTSADAAGLPIFPGLLRLDEVNAGVVNHAIRFTVQRSAASFVWPARHQAGSGPVSANPPMGARFRMQAGVDITHFSPRAQVVLRAFQHYGLIAADNGSNWFFQGDANNAWPDSLIAELKRVPASAFEAVDESALMLDPNSAQARQPGGGGGVGTPAQSGPRPAPPLPAVVSPVGAAGSTSAPPPTAPSGTTPRSDRQGVVAERPPDQPAPDERTSAHIGAVVSTELPVARGPMHSVGWAWFASVPVALAMLLGATWRRRRRTATGTN